MSKQAFYDLTNHLKSFHYWDKTGNQYQQKVLFLSKWLRHGGYRDCSELHCYQHMRLEALALVLLYLQPTQEIQQQQLPKCPLWIHAMQPSFKYAKTNGKLFYRQLKSWMLRKERSCFVCRLCSEEIHKGGRQRLSRYYWGTQWLHLNMPYCLKLPLQPDLAVSAPGPCGNFHPRGWRFEQCRHQLDTYPRQGWPWL